MDDISTLMLLFLFLAAILAGFIDSIAGGGGLIGVPALLIAGVPPVSAIGTNKISAIFGVASATYSYASNGHVNLKKQWPMALIAAIASVFGAATITYLPEKIFNLVLPFLLISIALYFYFKPTASEQSRARIITPLLFGAIIVPIIGYYDGIFGPGAGSFYMLAFVSLSGFGLLKATAHTKLLNFSSNFGSFLFFAITGGLYWKIGILMGIGQMIGAQIGAHLAMKKGTNVIKPMLVIVCIAMAIKLISDADHPIWALF